MTTVTRRQQGAAAAARLPRPTNGGISSSVRRSPPFLALTLMTFNQRVLAALGGGLAAGAILRRVAPEAAVLVSDVVAPAGSLWVNALLMLVMPLVLASLVVGVASAADLRAIGRLGRKTAAMSSAERSRRQRTISPRRGMARRRRWYARPSRSRRRCGPGQRANGCR